MLFSYLFTAFVCLFVFVFVLTLENTPLVKFIGNYIRDLSGITSEDINGVIPHFSQLFVQTIGEK